MAKRPPKLKDVELRRWCVEMAMRWPVFEDRLGGAYGAAVQGGMTVNRSDANIIARAEKILEWVSN